MRDVESLETNCHGYSLRYSDNTRPGMDYLKNDLDGSEADVIFEYARKNDEAPFEDDHGRDFLLIHDDAKEYHIEER